MAKKTDELIIHQLADRWTVTHNPAAGTTVIASQAGVAKALHQLTTLNCSIANMTAAAVTVTLSVRDSSIAGTVLAQFGYVVGTNSATQSSYYLDLPGLIGNAIVAEMGTPAASVTQKITICGWTEFGRSG